MSNEILPDPIRGRVIVFRCNGGEEEDSDIVPVITQMITHEKDVLGNPEKRAFMKKMRMEDLQRMDFGASLIFDLEGNQIDERIEP